MPFEGIGASVRRKEDSRFLSGRGNYTDDINRPGQLHAYIRRADRPLRLLRPSTRSYFEVLRQKLKWNER